MHRAHTWARSVALLCLATTAAAGWVAPAAAAEPRLGLSKSSAAPGETIVVTLAGWPAPTTVTVCGNAGRRGAADCDQIGGVAVGESSHEAWQRELVVTTPPANCPCVVRAATPGEHQVVTAPIEIAGVPTGPLVGPSNAANVLRVQARVDQPLAAGYASLRSALGGPTKRVLVVTVDNTGTDEVTDVSVTAALARSAQGGEPLQVPGIDSLPPGGRKVLHVEVTLPPPAFGTYVVFGTVYGPGAPVTFAQHTTNLPWALVVVCLVLLADVGAMFGLRVRSRRRSNRTLLGPEPEATPGQTEVEQIHPAPPRAAFQETPPPKVDLDASSRPIFGGAAGGRADSEQSDPPRRGRWRARRRVPAPPHFRV